LLHVDKLHKAYKKDTKKDLVAIQNISFQLNRGEFVSIVGPSGCGKTTLLMCIAGLMEASGGKVLLNGTVIKSPPKEMVLIFQNYTNSLFPWRTVLGNVLFALGNRHIPKKEKLKIAEKALINVGLEEFLSHYPWELSGGMQQRVAIARGLAYGSDIILMDEPFASVDAQTRSELEDLLLDIWTRYSRSILFVTHDIDEAIYLSNKVIVLSNRPSAILASIPVDLKRPRNHLETKAEKKFIEIRNQIYSLIRSSDG
jgi:NitT/TauT family transport system ATP-binding protein